MHETRYEKMATIDRCCHAHQPRATYQCSAAYLVCVAVRRVVREHDLLDATQQQ